MICQSCKKKEASFHYTSNDNGNITELHLCHDCAKKGGYLDDSFNMMNPFNLFDSGESMLGSLMGEMFGEPQRPAIRESSVCPFCGMRLNEFMHGAKAGCAKCYTSFKDAIAPTVKKLHGNTRHTGKIPSGRAIHKSKEDKRAELHELLNKAIETQEYEKAAKYRDEIKALDNENA